MSGVLLARVDDIERRLGRLQRELADVRAQLQPEPVSPPAVEELRAQVATHEPAPLPVQEAPPGRTPPTWTPEVKATARPSRQPKVTARPISDRIAGLDLLGARSLALVGGAVMLLGIAFFFVLAANHGWIGPGARVAFGGAASALTFGAGLVLRRKYGQLHSAVAAVGAGIAGGYTTLLAASAIYDLVSEPVGMAVAAGIAAVAVAVAIRWRSEIIAWLGVLGAAAVPALHAIDGNLSPAAVGFVVLVFAAAVAVSLRQRWSALLGATAAVTYAQMLWLLLTVDTGDTGATAVAAAFFALLLMSALGQQRVSGEKQLDTLAASLAGGATGLAIISSITLFGYDAQAGVLLLVAGAALVACAVAAFRLCRDLAVLMGGLALVLAALATADLLSRGSLSIAYAAEAVVLAVVSARLREPRFRIAALAYLALALAHTIVVEAPLGLLFDDAATSYVRAVPSLVAVAVAALFVAWGDLPWKQVADVWRAVRAALVGVATLLLLDAVSLVVVEISFSVGHVIVTAIWACAGLAAVALGARFREPAATNAGFAWLLFTLVKVIGFDWSQLGESRGAVSLLAVALCVLLAGVALRVLDDRDAPLAVVSLVCAVTSLVGFVVAIGVLVDGDRARGAALLAPVALFAALAVATFAVERLRNLSTVLWSVGLVGLLIAEAAIVQGRGTVVAFAVTAAALACLAAATGERRLHEAAMIVLGTTTFVTIAFLTTPIRLVHATEHPGVSLWTLASCVAAGAVLAACNEHTRTWIGWLCAGLGVYGLSLGILELAERISSAGVATDFQRGHTAVTALWGLIGLGLLVAGLLRRSNALRFGGLALFGLGLAKLFLYDLSALSSVTRALSFLAVGGFMLAGGFFLQRLSARLDQRVRV